MIRRPPVPGAPVRSVVTRDVVRGFLQRFGDNAKFAWGIIGATVLLLAASTALLASTASIRYTRDINRIVFNRNWELLDEVTRGVLAADDSLGAALAGTPEPSADQAYVVVSIEDRRLWYKKGDETLFTTRVAVGSGRTLIQDGDRTEWKFDTPRGRLVVQYKEIDPIWVPPDWHYVERARAQGLGVVRLARGQSLPASDGSVITVLGNDVVRQFPDRRIVPYDAGEGREIVEGGNIIIPPFGTNQRKFDGVLGSHRLNLGDGYALHGTDQPQTIGEAVSHGCVRLRNEDIAYLFSIVPKGTAVYIY